ncbi:restriction endonuclease subunit S [Streptomyces sp. NPDC008313]|uniref:restriction endonuclease subunit S n=1 Tax=Streptomyces sp. NPDC008313 TaxID=3364826 RepID=UPI0036E3ED23
MSAPTVRIGDVSTQIRGVTYGKGDAVSNSSPGYLPILRAGNIEEVGISFDDLVYVPAVKAAERQQIRRGDVLIAASSGSLSAVGKAAQATADFAGAFGAFCKVLRPCESVDARYFGHFFRTAPYRRHVAKVAAGANINNLRNEHLDDLTLRLPSLTEQKRIATVLDQVDNLRAKRREAIVLLDDLAQSIFLGMFGEFPKSARLADFSQVQGGLQLSGARKTKPHEVPYLRVANVYRGRLRLDEVKTLKATPQEIERTRLVKGDLLVVEGHGNANEIGRTALWDGSIEVCTHQNHLIRIRVDRQYLIPEYVEMYLNSAVGRRHLLSSANTTSGLNTISTGAVKENPIAVPDMGRQQGFLNRLNHLREVKQRHLIHLAALDELFTSLQHRAFSGTLWDHAAPGEAA